MTCAYLKPNFQNIGIPRAFAQTTLSHGFTPGFWKNHNDANDGPPVVWPILKTTTLGSVFTFAGAESGVASRSGDSFLMALQYDGDLA